MLQVLGMTRLNDNLSTVERKFIELLWNFASLHQYKETFFIKTSILVYFKSNND